MKNNPSLSVNVCGVEFKNPIIAASGCFGFGDELTSYYDPSILGGVSLSAATLKPRKGNKSPRVAETYGGMLNSVGLQNPGIDEIIEVILPRLAKYDFAKIVNIAGECADDMVECAKKLNGAKYDMLELNLSCPNVDSGGMAFGVDPTIVENITSQVKKAVDKPLVVKLSPNVTDIRPIALAAERGGADAISLINTVLGMRIDARARKPILANIKGGLSGPAIKPIALHFVHTAAKTVNIPIIGMGGIMSGEDAVEFLLAGASAVMVGAASIFNPMAMKNIINEIEEFIIEENIQDVSSLCGSLIV